MRRRRGEDSCGPRGRRRRRRAPERLHRILFLRFGLSILVTFAIVGALFGQQRFIDNKWLAIGVAAFALWAAAGAIAHRLVRPLAQVAQVARDIGDGELGSRVSLRRHPPGEIGELATAINDMAERIEKQMADQRALLAAVSHEIRTPLGHMRVIAELARDGDKARLAELEAEIALVDGLVDKLLASSRLDFDTLSRRPLDAVDVCLRALERAELDASLLGVECDDASFEGDAMLVSRAVGNLLENSARHAERIESVTVDANDDSVLISVTDRGPGFSDDALATAFEQFRPSGGVDGSLGLGLALARRIAEAHGGSATATNVDGGARVTLELARRPGAEGTGLDH